MTDLVERLRELHSPDDYWQRIVDEVKASGIQVRHALLLNHQAANLLALATIARDEAADEIERLRAALRKICEPITVMADAETVSACQDLHELICMQARAALGEAKGLRALPSADALEAARRILAAVAGMQGEKLAIAFRDEQTASHVSFIIENAARVSRALLQADE